MLLLAAVGIYGMLSYAVSHRRREFGIRLALGARPSEVLRLILREGLTLVVGGCGIGLVGTYVAGRSLAGFLFEVKPCDPVTLAGVLAVVLWGATVGLSCHPERRRPGPQGPSTKGGTSGRYQPPRGRLEFHTRRGPPLIANGIRPTH